MKKQTSIALAIAFTGMSVAAVAAVGNQLRGSDTLESMTETIMGACSGVTTLVYIGGGSSNGEDAMRKGDQQIAPMSRQLQAARTCKAANPAQAEHLAVALDGISIPNGENECVGDGIAFATSHCFSVADTFDTDGNGSFETDGTACGADCTGAVGAQQYCLANERDVLRIIFSGLQKGGGATLGNMKCDGDVRRSLVNQYTKLFSGACSGTTCTSVKHAWRRDDLSGTTDTFLALLGLPSILSATGSLQVPFCNGTSTQDVDPIRVACDATDDVCNVDGKSGLVLPVFVPEVAPGDEGTEYPAQACSVGKFALKAAQQITFPDGSFDYLCPEGTQYSVASFCLSAYADKAPLNSFGAEDQFNCLNAKTNNSVFTAGRDGRVFNKWVRKANGAIVADKAGRLETNAFYRVRTSACHEISSTRAIGCLGGHYACTIGFAGREAADPVELDSKALAIKGIFPTVPDIRKLITSDPTAYPLSRLLYLNTAVGFENVSDTQEDAVSDCFHTQATVDSAATSAGFVTLDMAPFCQDFNETSCNSTVMACDTAADCGFAGKGTCVGGNPGTPATLDGFCDQSCVTTADCLQPGRTCQAKTGVGTCDTDTDCQAVLTGSTCVGGNPATTPAKEGTCSGNRCDFPSNNNACL